MVVSAAFALLKLLNSPFAAHVDLEHGKRLFNETVSAIRGMSVKSNDRPLRLAEVVTRLWTAAGSGSTMPPERERERENSLRMKVRCRMSMSHVFDSVWRWREYYRDKGRGNIESELLFFRFYSYLSLSPFS